jgi:hypothetical protein
MKYPTSLMCSMREKKIGLSYVIQYLSFTGARIRIQDVLTTRQYLSLPCTFNHTLSTKKKHHQRTKNKQMESPNEGEGGTLIHTKTKIQPAHTTGVGGGVPHHQLGPIYSTTCTEMKPSNVKIDFDNRSNYKINTITNKH